MSKEIPVYPEDVSAAFLSELAGELRPGVTVEAVDVIAVRGYGDVDTSHSVSTSTQVSFEGNRSVVPVFRTRSSGRTTFCSTSA